jgi:hypothetical protein
MACGADRVEWIDVDSILGAFQQAEAQLSPERIIPLVNVDELIEDNFWPILIQKVRTKRWIWFGRETETVAMRPPAAWLLKNAVQRITKEDLYLDTSPAVASQFMRQKAPKSKELAFWDSVFDWDHNLPEHWKGAEGPSLVPPSEIPQLIEVTNWLLAQPEMGQNEYMKNHLSNLSALLIRCGKEDGLMIGL